MNDNMIKLLDKIDYKSDFLSDAKLIKIVGNKNKTKYNFNIEVLNTLPLNVYLELDQ